MRLIEQLQRLYCLPEQTGYVLSPGAVADGTRHRLSATDLEAGPAGEASVALDLTSPDGRVRALVIEFARSAHWPQAAALCQGLSDDLELPTPAVAVGGPAGYQLWLSLAEPLPLAMARDFLQALRQKYLADVPAATLRLYPGEGNACPRLPPAALDNGGWTAFIDPTMGAMFADETWLPMAPNADKQADMLATLGSIKTGDFQRALAQLQAAVPAADHPPIAAPAASASAAKAGLQLGGDFSDPKDFLLALMNDAAAPAAARVEAAKALLPYFHAPKA
ncbi:MAG TPA: hypothetical protein VJ548_04275 [Azospira sp.]|nr:hypothetical protein [Azospira sp.]